MNMMTAISTATASPTAAPSLAAPRTAGMDVVERYRCAKAALQQVSTELDDAQEIAEAAHGYRPAALIAWRNYSAIGGCEIEAMRERLLAAGDDAQVVEKEYKSARKRYRAVVQAGNEWDKRAGLEALARRADDAGNEFATAQEALEASSPATLEEALSLLDVIRENVEESGNIQASEVSVLAKANRFLQAGFPADPKPSTACERDPIEIRKANRRAGLAQAFLALEPDVCDLARMARLAELQLQKAIGDLRHEDGICVEVPDTENAEIATFAVSLLAEKVQGLKREWYRLHEEAVAAARNASQFSMARRFKLAGLSIIATEVRRVFCKDSNCRVDSVIVREPGKCT